RDPQGLGGHAVVGQEGALTLGGRAAVAPHRRDDERAILHLLEGVNDGPGDPGDPVDAPAADPDGDCPARAHALAPPAGTNPPASWAGYVLHHRLRDRLKDARQLT